MNILNKYILSTMLIFALFTPFFAIAEDSPDEVKKEDGVVLPVFSAELEKTNQEVVDTKNAQLSGIQSTLLQTADSAEPVMPSISAEAVTTANGTIIMTFTDGTILPSDLSGLWAKVTYNGKTQYWKLDPSMLSADGKSFSMQFGPEFNGITFDWQLYGFSLDNTKTNSSNTVTFTVNTLKTLTMPQTSAPATTTAGGQIIVTLATPILPSQLTSLWAKVTYDNKTEYWKLDPGMISADGKSFTMNFDPQFNGKTISLALFGYAASNGSQTNTTNAVTFTVTAPGTVIMPQVSAPVTTALDGQITVTLVTPVAPSRLSSLWAKVTFDNKTEYWKLDPGMISTDGKSFTMKFDPQFNGKTVSLALFGYAASNGAQTNTTNAVTFTVTAPGTVTIPAISAPAQTDVNGNISIGFASALLPSTLSDVWAIVKYDGKTEYWDLDTSMISADGKTFTMQFDKSFSDKQITMQLYGIAKSDQSQTRTSNAVTFKIIAAQSTVTMPVLPATVNANVNGVVVVTFSSGTILPSQLSALWAEVKVDNTTEYWNIGTGALSTDGKSLTLQFAASFEGKTVAMRIYGFDNNNVQTTFSNSVNVAIPTSNPAPAMPTLPSTLTTDNNGNAVITFTSGTILPSQLSGLWVEVKYGTRTEYWNVGTGALAADGKSISLQFNASFDDQTVLMRIYGFDIAGKQTSFSNTISILVNISA